MKPKLIVILTLIILLPLLALSVLGFRLISQEREYVKEKFQFFLEENLKIINSTIEEIIASHARDLLKQNGYSVSSPDNYSSSSSRTKAYQPRGLPYYSKEELRNFVRKQRILSQVFIFTPNKELLFPPMDETQTQKEKDFFTRTESIWVNKETFYKSYENSYNQIETQGWYTWFWGDGVNLIFWTLDSEGYLIGFEIHKIALIADIIGKLPDSSKLSPLLEGGRIILKDISEKNIYQWGAYNPPPEELPSVRIQAAYPLNSWTLECYMENNTSGEALNQGSLINLVVIITISIFLFVGIAFYFYKENSREIKEAARKVSFVNQVSHELKTPLTNIRLYAELLDNKLDEGESKIKKYLSIIVSESQRLSRLISNVLSFARDKKNGLKIKKILAVPDDIIKEIIDGFKQPFEQLNLKVDFKSGATEQAWLDKDLIKQIVGNLFNNIEKYAPKSKDIYIESSTDSGFTYITIKDRGPGIPARLKEKIFNPFFRISNKLSDGVSGTGLGLTIARKLARLHGGDLTLNKTDEGASFTLSLYTQETIGNNKKNLRRNK